MLKKGAAITGTVTNADGEPVVLVPIVATQIRNELGRRNEYIYGFPRYTDDRGIYRLYGLPPGTYLIAAASKALRSTMSPYEDHTPTYYPSSTREGATEVVVNYGSEATGIDIRYRGDAGHAISGWLMYHSPEVANVAFSVVLMRDWNDSVEAQTSARFRAAESAFSLNGVPDGDYHLVARLVSIQDDDGASSKRVPIKVRGHDITGMSINIMPLGSLSGRSILDPAAKSARCETKRVPAIEENMMSFTNLESDTDDESSRYSSGLLSPDGQGDFVFQGLNPGRYRIDSRSVLDESWYIKTVTVPSPTNTPVDIGGNGIIVRSGQRTNGVRVVLGQGAASVRGQVLTEKEGGSLPDHLRVYLVPSEQNFAEDLLRYIEADVQTDGSFKLLNAAPGKYWLIARPLPEEDLKMRIPRPQAWKSSSRAVLRREASAANVAIELKPCQRAADFQLRYSPAKEAVAPKRQ